MLHSLRRFTQMPQLEKNHLTHNIRMFSFLSLALHVACCVSQSSADKYDITFLDWQVGRLGTVAIDLSYFIFCCTDADVRKRLPDLMRIYHNELIQRIDELGSDGQALFPYEKLEWHMKKYAKFGLGSFIFYYSMHHYYSIFLIGSIYFKVFSGALIKTLDLTGILSCFVIYSVTQVWRW